MFAPLLDRIDDLTDTVVTGDQLHTQRGHATYLRRRSAHYVFTVGENQPNLYAACDGLPWQAIAIEHATVDRGHGRIEVRTIKALPATERIRDLFPSAEQVFLLERYIYAPDGTLHGAVAVLGITSLPTDHADAEDIAAYVRGHWSVEALHRLRDVTFGEDNSTVKRAYQAMAATQPHHQHLHPPRHTQPRPPTPHQPPRPLPTPPPPTRTHETKPPPTRNPNVINTKPCNPPPPPYQHKHPTHPTLHTP